MPLDTLPQWLAMGLPKPVAVAQAQFDRRRAAFRMREAGLTFDAIGERLGVGRERARQIVLRGERSLRLKSSPFDAWAADKSDLTDAFRRSD